MAEIIQAIEDKSTPRTLRISGGSLGCVNFRRRPPNNDRYHWRGSQLSAERDLGRAIQNYQWSPPFRYLQCVEMKTAGCVRLERNLAYEAWRQRWNTEAEHHPIFAIHNPQNDQ